MRQLVSSARNNDPRTEFAKITENSPNSAVKLEHKCTLGVRSMNIDVSDHKIAQYQMLSSASKYSDDFRLYGMELPPQPYPHKP